jgi:hypothetical protein
MIHKLFGRKDDPLTEQAGNLVQTAYGSAISSLAPMLAQFPTLKQSFVGSERQIEKVKHFDFILTIAGVFVAITQLRNMHLGERREQKLMEKVSERITKWNPTDGIRGFKHCKSFFEKNCDALAKVGHEPKYVASDVIGLWIAWASWSDAQRLKKSADWSARWG